MVVNTRKMNKVLEDSGLKLQYIARKVGVTRQTMTRVRTGKEVRPITICKVAEALGCSVNDLIDG